MPQRDSFQNWFSDHIFLIGFLSILAYIGLDLILNSYISGDLDQGVLKFFQSPAGAEDIIRFLLITLSFAVFSFFTKRVIDSCKKKEEEQRKYANEIKNFAYSVSHDLKGPAVVVHGFAKRLLNRYCEAGQEERVHCEQIMRAAEYINALVENVNTFIKTREIPMRFETVNVWETLRLIREGFSSQLNDRKIEWSYPKEALEIKADNLSLQRIFKNLLDNALKYGGENLSRITTECDNSQPDYHLFSFSDDGKGILEDDCDRVFDPFLRLRPSKEVDGSGMGLAIVKEIVELHGGNIWVESMPEKGTTFFFTIRKKLGPTS